MIKIFLQNLSASEFKESNFTNHRQARIQKIFPGGVQPSRITVENGELSTCWLTSFSLSLSLSLLFRSDQAWPWPWWRVSSARGVCVTLLYIIFGPEEYYLSILFNNFCFIILLICRVIVQKFFKIFCYKNTAVCGQIHWGLLPCYLAISRVYRALVNAWGVDRSRKCYVITIHTPVSVSVKG
mgnify:CR=1 FL=1